MKNKLFNIFLIVLICVALGMWGTLFQAQGPANKAEAEVTEVAESEGDITDIDEFYIFNKSETYYTIRGKNEDGDLVYFSYQPDTEATKTVLAKDVISRDDALGITLNDIPGCNVMEARLGVEDDMFVWEVSFEDSNGQLGYHYLNASNGQWTETINNL